MLSMHRHGGMAEWLIAALLKRAGREARGFESLSLRQSLVYEPRPGAAFLYSADLCGTDDLALALTAGARRQTAHA